MATPHIAGAMALLWSAIPSLQNQIDASRAALNNAAHSYFFHPVRHRGTAKQRLWLGPGRYPGRCNQRHTNTDSDTYTWTDQLSAEGRKVGGINTSRLKWRGATSDQRRRLPQWNCDRDNAERWLV